MPLSTEPQVHLWTRNEYYKMAEAGLFDGKHVELIQGQVIEMTPTGSLHATAVALAARRLEKAFAGYFVRWQMPLVVSQARINSSTPLWKSNTMAIQPNCSNS